MRVESSVVCGKWQQQAKLLLLFIYYTYCCCSAAAGSTGLFRMILGLCAFYRNNNKCVISFIAAANKYVLKIIMNFFWHGFDIFYCTIVQF